MPDREERFAAMLDAVEAVGGRAPRVLDLAGGTGSISLRTLRRFPAGATTLVDVDPVLLDDRARLARRPDGRRDAPTCVRPTGSRRCRRAPTTPCSPRRRCTGCRADRLAALYAEVRDLLRPGGVFVNADHMPDEGLPGLTEKLGDLARERREARYAAGAVLSWEAWWDHVAKDPTLGPLVERRNAVFASRDHTEWTPAATWHLDALRAAGYAEVGLLWRGADDAAVAGIR